MKPNTHTRLAAFALCLGGATLLARGLAAAPAAPLCLEAEWGKLTAPVKTYLDKQCSGGTAIEVPTGSNPKAKEGEEAPKLTGESTITFRVSQEGTYRLWGRAWWRDGCGNSYGVSVDDGPRTTITDGSYKRWHWVAGPKLTLAAGTHVLKIHNTEDGARMDQVFLTTDPKRVPVVREKPTPAAQVK